MSTSNLNADAVGTQARLKRKFNDVNTGPALGETFSIACSSSPLQRLTLTPRRLIPRFLLPLAYLDLSHQGELPFSRLLTATSRTLQPLTDDAHCLLDPHILLAEGQGDGVLYAIEGVRDGVYALCRLAAWVSLDDFGRGEAKFRRVEAPPQSSNPQSWWSHAEIKLRRKPDSCNTNIGKLKSISRPPPAINQVDDKLLDDAEPVPERQEREDQGVTEHNRTGTSLQDENPTAVLCHLREQYLKALYVSKMSLAFFAKGPLARARAVCTSAGSGASQTQDLSDTLRSMTYKIPTFDAKYKDALPKLLEEVPQHLLSDDEASTTNIFASRFRKSKKRKKISKEGFMPSEEEHAIHWWIKSLGDPSIDNSNTARQSHAKNALSDQKAREIQMQILLVVEDIALDGLQKQHADKEQDLDAETEAPYQKKQQGKKSKEVDKRSNLLDLLVDKLCIWDSISQDDFALPDLIPKARMDGKAGSSTERLRSFCTEVLVPFYNARLPHVIPSICAKLGAPIPSPSRAKAPVPQPGTIISQPRKPLARNHSDTQSPRNARPRPLGLSRSATEPSLPSLQRSLSSASLPSPALAAQPMLDRARRREVDLGAAARAATQRHTRQEAVQQQLAGAIDTLKRPDRRAAVREYVDEVDRRTSTSSIGATSRARKAANPTHNPLADSVHVFATPKVPRYRPRAVEGGASAPSRIPQEQEEGSLAPSSGPCVPSSSVKPAAAPGPSVLDSLKKSAPSFRPVSRDSPTLSQHSSVQGKRGHDATPSPGHHFGQPRGTDVERSSVAVDQTTMSPTILHSRASKRPLAPGNGNLTTPTFNRKRLVFESGLDTEGENFCVEGTPTKGYTAL